MVFVVLLVESKCVQPGGRPEPAQVFWDVGDGEDPSGRLPRPQNFQRLLLSVSLSLSEIPGL